MASGFGAKGSEGRCYPLWQGFSKVFIILMKFSSSSSSSSSSFGERERERDPIFLLVVRQKRGKKTHQNEKHFYPPRVLLLLFSLTKNDDLRDSHYFNTRII